MIDSNTLGRAHHARGRGDVGLATRLLREHLRQQPDDFSSWVTLAGWLEQDGDIIASIEAVSSALRHAPSQLAKADMLQFKGMLLGDTLEFQAACESLQASLNLRRPGSLDSVNTLVLLACVLARRGLMRGARLRLEEALRVDPENEDALYNLCVSLRGLAPQRAVPILRSAAPSDTLSRESIARELALAYQLSDRAVDAIAVMVEEQPYTEAVSAAYLCYFLLRQGEYEAAHEATLDVVCSETEPLRHYCLYRLSKEIAVENHESDHRHRLIQALMIDPTAAWSVLRVLSDLGEAQDARSLVSVLVRKEPGHPYREWFLARGLLSQTAL